MMKDRFLRHSLVGKWSPFSREERVFITPSMSRNIMSPLMVPDLECGEGKAPTYRMSARKSARIISQEMSRHAKTRAGAP